MSHALKSVPSLSEAWLLALEQTMRSPCGRIANLMTTITQPGHEIPCIRRGIDRELKRIGEQNVDTVAETIFPRSLYVDPGIDWWPDLPQEQRQEIDQAAIDLYDNYLMILPMLRTEQANRMGTYFSRMISWPGKKPRGTNQLARVIDRIRGIRCQGKATENTIDMDLAADCLIDETSLEGAQLLAADDNGIADSQWTRRSRELAMRMRDDLDGATLGI